jgi:hypothetical protein
LATERRFENTTALLSIVPGRQWSR